MEKLTLCLVFLVLGLGMAQSRSIKLLNSTYPLVDSDRVERNQYPSVSLGGKGVYSSSSSNCFRMYGFLPCADNAGGYFFLVVVYKMLLYEGNKLVDTGSTAMFNLLGVGIFGGSIFGVLQTLPSIVMIIVSGVFTTEASAQYQVSSSVGVYVGSTVFLLTFFWGTCVMRGSQKPHENKSASGHTGHSISDPLLEKKGSGSGIKLDDETSTTAGIILVSLIPFVLMLFVNIFKTSSGSRVMVLVVLIVSTLCLLSYFAYQIWGPLIQEISLHGSKLELPRIQERSLHYSKLEHLVDEFSKNIGKLAKGKLINVKGKPDFYALKSALAQFDENIKFTELDAVLREMRSGQDEIASRVKHLLGNGHSSGKITLGEIVQPGIKKRRHELNERVNKLKKIEDAMGSLQIPRSEAKSLLTDNGEHKSGHIESIFEMFDSNSDETLSDPEFKKLIETMKVKEADLEELVKIVRGWFGKDADQNIGKQEFVYGVLKWLTGEESDEATWKEVDSLLSDTEGSGDLKFGVWKPSKRGVYIWKFSISFLQMLVGIAIMTFLAGPLMYNVRLFSAAISIPSFFSSFVILPLAIYSSMLRSALFPKNVKTASLTFSEIYSGVIMNNLTGSLTLLAIVYAKDLTWDYNAEVLVLLVVCVMIGLPACYCSTYHFWEGFLAYFTYPFSLVFYYILRYVWGWD